MERQDDGDEPVGSLNHHDSAEEPGKSSLFLQRFLFNFWKECRNNADDGNLCARTETKRGQRMNHCICSHFSWLIRWTEAVDITHIGALIQKRSVNLQGAPMHAQCRPFPLLVLLIITWKRFYKAYINNIYFTHGKFVQFVWKAI